MHFVDRLALISIFLITLVDKRVAIAKRVEDLGDHLCPAMLNGWLAFIRKTYSADADELEATMGQGELIVPDNECLL